MALPGMERIRWRLSGGWDFPEKTVLIKNFLMPLDERDPEATAQRIETRLLYRRNGQWNGFSYEWNEAGTDATLLVQGQYKTFTITDRNGQPAMFDYLYPSRNQCQVCHTAAAGGVLGLNTPQMNSNFDYPASGVTDNQLRVYDHIGLFDAPLPVAPPALPSMPDPFGVARPVRDRARAYLAANCSMCHQPGAPAPTNLDLRWEVADSAMHAIDVFPGNGDLGIAGGLIIAPGDPDRSILLERVNRRDGLYQMPPLASSRIDQDAVELLRQYILNLPTVNAVGDGSWLLYR